MQNWKYGPSPSNKITCHHSRYIHQLYQLISRIKWCIFVWCGIVLTPQETMFHERQTLLRATIMRWTLSFYPTSHHLEASWRIVKRHCLHLKTIADDVVANNLPATQKYIYLSLRLASKVDDAHNENDDNLPYLRTIAHIFSSAWVSVAAIKQRKIEIKHWFYFLSFFYNLGIINNHLRDFIFKKTLFEKLQYLKQEQ